MWLNSFIDFMEAATEAWSESLGKGSSTMWKREKVQHNSTLFDELLKSFAKRAARYDRDRN
jgi:hypothetical protein